MIVPVEIEVNIEGNVDEALSTLNDALGPTTKRQIWFAEARAGAATGELTLLVNHVIVRLRRGDGPDDLTLKLRPCVERQLGGRWQESFHTKSFDYRIELKATGPGRGRYWRLRRARNTARAWTSRGRARIRRASSATSNGSSTEDTLVDAKDGDRLGI